MNSDGIGNISSQSDDMGSIFTLLAILIVLLFVFRNHGKDRVKKQSVVAKIQNPNDAKQQKMPVVEAACKEAITQVSPPAGAQNAENESDGVEMVFDKTNAEVLARINQAESEEKACIQGMTDAKVLAEINLMRTKRQSNSTALIILALSVALFIMLGAYRWSLEFVIMLAVAILIHELGHLLAMKIYGYKNLKMLFIPLFGGVAMGEPDEHDSFKMAVISMAGPIAGLLAGVLSIVLGVVGGNPTPFIRFAGLSFLLNILNLLPIFPLDGGAFLNEMFFTRFPRAELCFKIFAICGLAYLALHQAGFLFGIIAFFIFITLPNSYKISKMIVFLRRDEKFANGTLDEERIARIRTQLRTINPYYESKRNIKGLPGAVKNIWNKVQMKYPGPKTTIFLVGLYLIFTIGLISFTVDIVRKAQRKIVHVSNSSNQ